jgi:hypothetical protein
MRLALSIAAFVALSTQTARVSHADDVFEVCKRESKSIVNGKGKMTIAMVMAEDFPGRTQRRALFPIGTQLAIAEKARVARVADIDRAIKLMGAKRWSDKSDSCGIAPSLSAILGQKYPNLATAYVSIQCADPDKKDCQLVVDLERHGRPTADRWVRYAAPLVGPSDSLKVIAKAAPKLVSKGPPPDAPDGGLATGKLRSGHVRVRSDVDGALEADKIMEASPTFAACGIKGRKPYDVRGYYAEWTLSARGTVFGVMVKPFGGRDPKDEKAAACLRKALETTQLTCPRDAKPVKVKTAICL